MIMKLTQKNSTDREFFFIVFINLFINDLFINLFIYSYEYK